MAVNELITVIAENYPKIMVAEKEVITMIKITQPMIGIVVDEIIIVIPEKELMNASAMIGQISANITKDLTGAKMLHLQLLSGEVFDCRIRKTSRVRYSNDRKNQSFDVP